MNVHWLEKNHMSGSARGELHGDMGNWNDSNNRDSGDMCGQSGGDSFLDLELES